MICSNDLIFCSQHGTGNKEKESHARIPFVQISLILSRQLGLAAAQRKERPRKDEGENGCFRLSANLDGRNKTVGLFIFMPSFDSQHNLTYSVGGGGG
jgi:hypothetical protein